ncbi:MAG: NADP-dependent isocitrate dehydrogenase [Wenzhouxiangellaceae bacterium]
MDAVLLVLREAGARLALEPIEIGKNVYERGVSAGIDEDAWESLRRTRVFLKAPITTPQGGGYKSLNVTVRKALGLFANVRPCRSYHPFVPSAHPKLDVVVIRENEEDTYGGIEHRQTAEVTQCLKLISRPGCERVIRYAFEYARAHGRRSLTCLTKDNIMKLTDGLFHQVFEEIRSDYPRIESSHMIVDIGTARLAARPEQFDVVVLPNLYGDIVSDVVAELSGSVGLAGSANIGEHCAMFEAVHGSAPDIAGRDQANPSGLLNAAIMMLEHIGQGDVGARIHNAWLRTLEDGVVTADIAGSHKPARVVGCRDFARAVVSNLGKAPRSLDPVRSRSGPIIAAVLRPRSRPEKRLDGVDVFLDWDESARDPQALGKRLQRLAAPGFRLSMISNRGVKVFPGGLPETFCTDHWRCRFVSENSAASLQHRDVLALLERIASDGLDFIKTEHLYSFDGQRGYSLGQGE